MQTERMTQYLAENNVEGVRSILQNPNAPESTLTVQTTNDKNIVQWAFAH